MFAEAFDANFKAIMDDPACTHTQTVNIDYCYGGICSPVFFSKAYCITDTGASSDPFIFNVDNYTVVYWKCFTEGVRSSTS